MLETIKTYVYRAFGLTFSSQIPLPELTEIKEISSFTDVVVELADLTSLWDELATEGQRFVINKERVLFTVANTGIFSINDGKKIIVSPMVGSNIGRIRLYILGTCMGALLMQRNILPLHGSAIAINGKAFAFVGYSGAGKSTLASALLNRGYKLLSDDVIPIIFSTVNVPIVIPAYPQQKLWEESLNEFGIESNQYQPLYDRKTKFAIPVQSQFETETLPLAGVFELVKSEEDKIILIPKQKIEKLQTLHHHTYRNFLLGPSDLLEWHFNTITKIGNSINVFQLRRPTSRFTAMELADIILSKIMQEV
ncbi:aldolase [Bacillaceae bacterium IKA-2]|nr:aldolase [Bacillaceae bacterium IKA-2]